MSAPACPPPTDWSSGLFGLPEALLMPSAAGFHAALVEAREALAAARQASVCRWQAEEWAGCPVEPGCFWLAVARFAKGASDLAQVWHVTSLALPALPFAAASEADGLLALLCAPGQDIEARDKARRLVEALERQSNPVWL